MKQKNIVRLVAAIGLGAIVLTTILPAFAR